MQLNRLGKTYIYTNKYQSKPLLLYSNPIYTPTHLPTYIYPTQSHLPTLPTQSHLPTSHLPTSHLPTSPT